MSSAAPSYHSTFRRGSEIGSNRHRHRSPLILAIGFAITLAMTAAACSQSADVATNPGTTAAPGATKPVGDARGSAGTTEGSTPGTSKGTTSTSSPKETTTTAKEPTGLDGQASTTSTSGAPSTTVANTPDELAFCEKGKAMQTAAAGLDPTKDPAAYLSKLKAIFADLTASAPPAVQADMNTINTILQTVTSLDKLDQTSSKTVDEAGKRVDVWAVAHCGSKFGS